jgi:hypothetical protein
MTGVWKNPPRCRDCGGDPRGEDHARGCPALPPIPREKLLRLAQAAEEGWAAKRAAKPATKGAAA